LACYLCRSTLGAAVRPRVLVVDDDLAIRRALARELRSEFEVVLVPSYEQAVAQLGGQPLFAAVITDYELGAGPDGLALLKLVAERTTEVLRVLVSASNERHRIEEALAEGVVHRFLPKPWPPGELVATLHRYSRSGTMRRVRQSARPAVKTKR